MIYSAQLLGEPYYFYDAITSRTVFFVTREINNDEYSPIFKKIDFKEGDVVLDIGANVGMVSILLVKKFPFLKIYSFEPMKNNYENLLKILN
ncbi:hypothetical protein [Brachyspira pilosicoli]|uniref:hypothetical protein n=1 Tax=Brachyspira pilosicoli TaxID=52584 RepID=UPI002543D337|nr:hypothetical protein [Brachyspira pilosicoli]WIH87734.1 hypothetical protein NEI05_09580 [Brachyspira pilosicoli]